MEEEKKGPLDIMFSEGKKVDLGFTEVLVRPIPLMSVKSVLNSVFNIVALVKSDASPEDIFLSAMEDCLNLLPLCIDKEVLDSLPAAALPFLIDALVEVNFAEASVKKWVALAGGISQLRSQIPLVTGQGSNETSPGV
jgi:hypothetical protein